MRTSAIRIVASAVASVALTALVAACAQPSNKHGAANLTGTITYRERIALPDNALVEVQLVDATDETTETPLVAERLLDRPGQVPIAFSLTYDPASIQSSRTYALRVRIRVDDDVWFASPADVRVITGGNPTQVELQLVRVSAGGPVAPSVSARGDDPDPPNLDPRVKSARDEARSIDARLDRLDMREITEGTTRPGFEPRRLRLWVRGDEPAKLTVTESVQEGRMAPTSSYYFRDGHLFWVRVSSAGYLLEGSALVLLVDARMQPIPNTTPDSIERNRARIDTEIRAAFASFGLDAPAL